MIPFARRALSGPATAPRESEGTTTLEWLESAGISRRTIDVFFRSFFGGVFFDSSLRTDATRLEFLLRMFAEGFACVPAGGMGEVAANLARGLPAETRIRLGSPVARIDGTRLLLESGERIDADAVILATGAHDLRRLVPELPEIAWCGTMSAWFATPDPAVHSPWLVLNGSGLGAFNHGAAMSAVADTYAPPGRGLFVANTAALPRGADLSRDVAADMRRTLTQILGARATAGWELVALQRIEHAIPRQWPQDLAKRLPKSLGARVFVAGDHLEDASINGAIRSGRLAATHCMQGMG